MKNYNDSMLQSMSNGVVTLDGGGRIVTCNASGCRIMDLPSADIIGHEAAEFFVGKNSWIMERIAHVTTTQTVAVAMDAELEFAGTQVSANLTVLPLKAGNDQSLGTMLMIEDISIEKRVKATMSRYMDPAIAAQMLERGTELLGGASTRATVLFSDIRGFTTLTEELGAQGTVAFLNEYFTIMVECINHEGGMLDKFIGDAIMAAFGLPIAHEDDEDRALRAAIEMIRGCRRYSEERLRRGQKPVSMGIGLNTDMVVSGNIGSSRRMDYTIIGDGVNLASRLESACKAYAAEILISESTQRRLRGTYRMREIDKVVVKGKTEPVAIYEVLDYHTDDSFPNMMEVLGHFAEGLRRYRIGEFQLAIGQFEKALAQHPRDALSGIYVARCQQLLKTPPATDWAGVWVMQEK
jgi:adenylate cyclase